MARDQTALIWTAIDEFRGIASVSSPGQPIGTCTVEDTFGCVVDPASGALVPTPDFSYIEMGAKSVWGTNFAQAQGDRLYITGLHAAGPIYSLDGGNRTWGGPDAVNTALMFGGYYWVTGQRNQTDTITVNATGGTYTLTVDTVTDGVPDGTPETTGPIAYNANDATIEAALETLSFVAGADVSVSSKVITWAGSLAAQTLVVYANDDNATGGSVYVTTSQGADDKVRAVWRRTLFRENPGNESILIDTDDTAWFSSVRPRPCYFADTRSNSGQNFSVEDFGDLVPTVGPTVTLFVFDNIARMFPDDQDTYTNGTRKLCADTGGTAAEDQALVIPSTMVAHQGRAVILPLTLSASGATSTWVSNEAIFWSRVNDASDLDDALSDRYLNVVLAPEHPTGYGVVASLTANELLLIKARGGALVLSGSLNDYTLLQLPNVKSTGQSMNLGTTSPVGYVYPVDGGGVWVWNGGDRSENISPNLDPEFWRPDYASSDFGPGHTSMAQWQEWIILPNNWLFDTDTGTWWRLENPEREILHHVSVDWRGEHLYATPEYIQADYDGDSAQFVAYDYDINEKRKFFSARFGPVDLIQGDGTGAPTDSNRNIHLHEIVLTASGTGRVSVQVTSDFTGEDSGEVLMPVANESGVDDDLMTTVRFQVPCKGTNFIIHVRSYGSGGAAPTVHRPIRIGYTYDQQIHRTDSEALATAYEFDAAFSTDFDSSTLYA